MKAGTPARTEAGIARERRPMAFTLLVLLVLVGPAAAANWLPREELRTSACAVEEARVDARARCGRVEDVAVRRRALPLGRMVASQRPRSSASGCYAWPPARAPDRDATVR